jgi:hypothetical protein
MGNYGHKVSVEAWNIQEPGILVWEKWCGKRDFEIGNSRAPETLGTGSTLE